MDAVTRRKRTRTQDLPAFKHDSMLAVDAEEGNTLALPGKPSQIITKVDLGIDLDRKWVVLIDVEGGDQHEFSPRSYIPVTM